jgi:hypothetical protein
MSTRIRSRLATTGGAVLLSSAMILGLAGTASAEPAASTAPSVAPSVVPVAMVAPDRERRCHPVFHRGWWFWHDEGRWDRGHFWEHNRHRDWRQGWWSRDCRR